MNYDSGVTIHLVDKVSSGLAVVARAFTQSQTAADALQNRLNKIHSTWQNAQIMAGAGAALAAPLVAATKSAMTLETALSRVRIQTNANADEMKSFNQLLTKTSNMTGIFSKPELGGFASEMYASGISSMEQIHKLLPLYAQGAEALKLMSGGKVNPNDTIHGLSSISHQFGKYDDASMRPVANAAVAMAQELPGGIKSLQSTGASVNVFGHRVLGIDPTSLMAYQAAVAQTSGSKGAGGQGRLSAANQSNFLQRLSSPGTFGSGLLSGKQAFAGAVLGLTDAQGASTVMKNGKLDFGLAQQKLAAFQNLSSLEIAQRMNRHIGLLGKKAGDERPLIQKALATQGEGVSKSQLTSQLFQYQFGAAKDVAMLFGDEKFLKVLERMKKKGDDAARSNLIEHIQEESMKTLTVQIERFHKSAETLSSTIGMQLIPHTTKLVSQAADLVNHLNALAEKHPEVVLAIAKIIAFASGLMFVGSVALAVKAAFMGLQFIFSPLTWAIKNVVRNVGPLIARLGGLRGILLLTARVILPLVAVIGSLIFIITTWDDTVKGVTNSIAQFIMGLGNVEAAFGRLLSSIGAQIASMPVAGPLLAGPANALKGMGADMQGHGNKVSESAGFGMNAANAMSAAKASAVLFSDAWSEALWSNLRAAKSKGPGGSMSKGTVINQTNNISIPHVPGAKPKDYADEIGKRISKKAAHATSASSGNSVGRSYNAGGAHR